MLPKLIQNEQLVYKGRIPSTKEHFEYRQLLVKEQLQFKEAIISSSHSEKYKKIVEILSQTIVSFPKDKSLETLSYFDFEGVFAQIYSESFDMKTVENEKAICEQCGHVNVIPKINVSNPQLRGLKKQSLKPIKLTETISLNMRFPTFQEFAGLEDISNTSEVLWIFIESVTDEDKIYPMADADKDEFNEFLGELNVVQFKQLEEYLNNNLPYISVIKKYRCVNCGHDSQLELKGIRYLFFEKLN
jgi:hypothetical protein